MADPPRLLLFHEDVAASRSLRARLAPEGFEVICAHSLLDAAPHIPPGRSSVLLIYLPETEWIGNAILVEVRRTNPSLPIVAIAPTITDELLQALARLGVTTVLETRSRWSDVLRSVHAAVGG